MKKIKKYLERFIIALCRKPEIIWAFDVVLMVAPFVGISMTPIIGIAIGAFAAVAMYNGICYTVTHWYDLPRATNIDIDGDTNVVSNVYKSYVLRQYDPTQTPRADDYLYASSIG